MKGQSPPQPSFGPKWYVLIKGHHQGPYTTLSIKQWLREGKIQKKSPIWREGLPDWVKLEDVEELRPKRIPTQSTKVIKSPRPSPKAPVYKRPLFLKHLEEQSYLPAVVFVSWACILGVFTFEPFLKALVSGSREFEKKRTEAKSLYETQNDLPKTSEMALKITPSLKVRWSKEGHKLFVHTIPPITAPITLTFTSISGKTLSSQEVSFSVKGIIKEGEATFDEFHFIRGDFIAEGHYKVEIETPINFKREKFEIFYGSDDKRFEQELRLKNEQEKLTSFSDPQEDLMERFVTLSSLLDKTQTLLQESIERVHEGRDIVVFKMRYMEQVASVLQGVVFDLKGEATQTSYSKEYKTLLNLGKEVGESVVDLLNSVEKKENVTSEQKKQIVNDFQKRVEPIKNSINSSVESLRQKI